jgi:preprotein translocase subunit SecF
LCDLGQTRKIKTFLYPLFVIAHTGVHIMNKLKHFYEKHHKQLMWIPIGLFVCALGILSFLFLTTGSIIEKDVSLAGGIVVTVEVDTDYNMEEVATYFSQNLDLIVTASDLKNSGKTVGVILKTKADSTEKRDELVALSKDYFDVSEQFLSVEQTQSQFGSIFFLNLLQGIFIALVLMGVVVYLTFRRVVPSLIIIFAVISDLLITLAIVSVFGLQLSSAGIAAFLMIIGYAVDTNVLLTWNMLKKPDLKAIDRIGISARTGLIMTFTTLGALSIALFVTNSAVISQILTILLVGLLVDLLNTWFLNTALLWRFTDEN